ncbi:putative ribonuclease H-like domain-containing protein [Tanacetum coccineum]
MQEELLQFKIQEVWILVDLPYGKKAIGTKWVYKNKKDERGVVVRNKARLVAQGYRQEDGINYDECDEFEALMKSRLQMSSVGELTFFLGLQVKQKYDGIFIIQDKYVAEILKKFDFASVKTANTLIETHKPLVKDEEATDVDVHLYRSMIGSLMYLTTSRSNIMFTVCACSRFQVTLKTSHLNAVERIFRYLKGKPKLGLWYPRVSSFNLEAYSDSDYVGANLDRKSTTEGCQFLGRRLISWQCKKQTVVATSTTEAEYVAAANCCGQVLWIQNQMLDYRFNFINTKIYIDNESTICIVKNLVFHSKTKHIEIRHHFIRDAYEKKLIQVLKIHTDDNVADLLTKAFDVSSWCCQAKLVLPGIKVDASRKKFMLLVTVTTIVDLEFVDQHNMVTCLEKTGGNSEFHEIVDFLTSSLIHHALTVSPTIYISYIKQFWNTTSSQTVNNEKQIHATIDSKAVVVTEASIRNSLLLHDADGTACLTNEAIFQNLALMRKGVKFLGKVILLFDFMLVPHQAPEGEGSEQPTEPQPTPSLTQPISGDQPLMTATSSGHNTTQDSKDSLEGTNKTSKDAQAAKIIKLKTRIKKLKKKSHQVISHHKAWLRSVSRLSMKRKLGRKESASKQGRKHAKPRPTLDAFDDLDADLAHGIEYMDTEEAVNKKGGSTVSTVRPERVSIGGVTVNTVDPEISVVEPRTPPTTASIFDDKDVTMAQTLIKMKEEKAKEKMNKGKGVLQEPEPVKKMAKTGEERKRQREEEASKAAIAEMYDKVQEGIDTDALFAVKLQQEEREEYIIEERAKFLAETIAAQ